jgi:hypothetical protein
MNELQLMVGVLAANNWESLISPDVADDDSDKTQVVPSGARWYVTSVEVNLAASADVGNRQVEVHFLTAGDAIVARTTAGAVQAADATVVYNFGIDQARETSVVAGVLNGPLPAMILTEGMKIRVYDSAAIAAAADDMHVAINGLKWQKRPTI